MCLCNECRRAALVVVMLACVSAAKPIPSVNKSSKKILLLR